MANPSSPHLWVPQVTKILKLGGEKKKVFLKSSRLLLLWTWRGKRLLEPLYECPTALQQWLWMGECGDVTLTPQNLGVRMGVYLCCFSVELWWGWCQGCCLENKVIPRPGTLFPAFDWPKWKLTVYKYYITILTFGKKKRLRNKVYKQSL